MSRWPGRLFWLCVVVLSLPAMAADQQETTVQTGWLDAAGTDLSMFGGRLVADVKATFFNGDNLAALGWAGLASAAMNNGSVDDEVAEHFDEHDTFTGFSDEALFVIGSPYFHFAGTAAWYILSAENQDDASRQQAVAMFSALTITAAITGGLKAIRDDDQPDGVPPHDAHHRARRRGAQRDARHPASVARVTEAGLGRGQDGAQSREGVSRMFGPNMASVKVAETRTRDDMRRADRERVGAEARERSRGSRQALFAARVVPERAFTRWTQRRRRVVTPTG